MSTSRGNDTRKRPQKHQNRTAFKNDLHDTSQKTKMLNSMMVTGICERCKGIIEWKIKYKKYKTLSAPSKCVGCEQKAVKHAYHVLCQKCSRAKKVCAKCMKPNQTQEEPEITPKTNVDDELAILLKPLPERRRRTILRNIKKDYGDQPVNLNEVKSKVEIVLQKIKECSLEDDDSEFSLSGNDSGSESELAF